MALVTIKACVYNRKVMPLPDEQFDKMVEEVKKPRGVQFTARGFPPCYGVTVADTAEVREGMIFVDVSIADFFQDFLDSKRSQPRLHFTEVPRAAAWLEQYK